jgi:chromosomal replication initiator protein
MAYPPDPVAVSDIQKAVIAQYGIPVYDLKSRRRDRAAARPRQIAMYLCRHLTYLSLPEIGRAFGNRDHTTVMHAVKTVDGLMASDRDLAVLIGALMFRLRTPGQHVLPLE